MSAGFWAQRRRLSEKPEIVQNRAKKITYSCFPGSAWESMPTGLRPVTMCDPGLLWRQSLHIMHS